ncbi:hypothetical protein AZI87_14605 [Bdellovibrio bacteriovorus]|uniref:Carboxylesterase type B domain-containing protein n=1 Tax=Bdellovibrio bacteriovorus TaxID=959 RepID=A0A162FV94_BDEBC|nr:carboxylesterase family protein [Bdellovibrio bacteriovorus]KYG62533.1 hypothetical protein AZI87_14605 [Bdellovibrio bacteriovorus]
MKLFLFVLSTMMIGLQTIASPRLQISTGQLEGTFGAYDTEAFLGIPYASPPVGHLRWKAPRAVRAWKANLKAKELPSVCPQIGNYFSNVPSSQFGVPVGNEDCLYLNVWKPKASKEKLPVVFWIHGGSNFKGTASDPLYDGSYLAASAHVVFVSVNYRLGLLGAISSHYLDGNKWDRSGNFTTLDLVSALTWVQKNIEHFDGDINNVTIMGQSAGCMNVWGLLQTPLAKNLFHKAVCSAGLPNIYPRKLAESRATDFLETLILNRGLVDSKDEAADFLKTRSREWLRKFMSSLSTDEIIRAQHYSVPLQHFVDDFVFPVGLQETVLGKYHQVPLIIGSTDDEATYLIGSYFLKPSATELWNLIQNSPADLSVHDLIKVDANTYRATTASGSLAMSQTTDALSHLMRTHQDNVYKYTFKWKQTPSPWKEVFGAVHGMDAMFYLGNFETEKENFARFAWTKENKKSREELRATMSHYFRSFFWTGSPNLLLPKKLPPWEKEITFE